MAKKKLTYKEAINALEEIITKLESEDVGVDDLSKHVKEATELMNFCRAKLKNTEKELEENMD